MGGGISWERNAVLFLVVMRWDPGEIDQIDQSNSNVDERILDSSLLYGNFSLFEKKLDLKQ